MQPKRILLCLLIGVLAIWQCSLVTATADLVIFSNGLTQGFSLATDEPTRISCTVANGKGINGGKGVAAFTSTYALPNDNCYIKFNSGHGTIGSYTELEFFIRANAVSASHGFAGNEMKDANGNLAGPNAIIPTTYTRFRYPLRNTFNGINLNNLLSPFYMTLFLVPGDAIYADQIVLRSRNYFDIFTSETSNGREVIYSWGGPSCFVKTVAGAPDGAEVLSVPATTWGCGLFFSDPYLDLSYFSQIQFYLKSPVDVLVEIQSNNQKHGVTVPSTNNYWQLITLDLTQFGLDFSQTYGPFLITKVGDASHEVQVDRIRYIPYIV